MGFTPGPWESRRDLIVGADGYTVADMRLTNRSAREYNANKSLILAAPDLIAACEFATKTLLPFMAAERFTGTETDPWLCDLFASIDEAYAELLRQTRRARGES